MSGQETFEQFAYNVIAEPDHDVVESRETQDRNMVVEALGIADPIVDFLSGSQLANNTQALDKAQKFVEKSVREILPGYAIVWSGTTATIYDNSGSKVDTTEIHGATWDKKNKSVRAVRFDVSDVKRHASQTVDER